ncbi:MAG: hypothetical protein CVU33_11640 [Betaproteobacteria bacterium HGW-Betaproteobacteria-6]|jgi:hypothetical protein|nr:MAG: hypothetical protein CVU33_11640 [Betaproteobacteria bacterium HGW-Betaproteobacteria-6]
MKNYRVEFPLEYCALRFLLQWLRSEEALYQAISSAPSDKDIRSALAYFQVSRNFKGLSKEPGKVAFIRKALISVRSKKALSPEKKVEKLTQCLESEFKQFNLSAASKLLWLSFREPFVIYDNRAVEALSKKLRREFSRRDYAEYSAAWRSEYAAVESEIEYAASQLPKGRIFMPSCRLTDRELLQLAKMPWFKERVFDIYLWEVGGDG